MNIKKVIAALSAVTMLSSLAVAMPVSVRAADSYEAKTTVTQTAEEAVNAKGTGVAAQNDSAKGIVKEVRMTPVAGTVDNNNGAKIGVFKLGEVKSGSEIKVSVSLKTCNNDLSGVGLYTTTENIGGEIDKDYPVVMKGNALAAFGTIGNPANGNNDNGTSKNPFSVSKTTFDTTNGPSGGSAGSLSSAGIITYTGTIDSSNAGNLYFIAGSWNGTNRHVQIVSITVEYSSTLANAVSYASNSGTVKLLKDSGIGSTRLTISKNVTLNADSVLNLQVSDNEGTGGVLANGNGIVNINNINMNVPLNNGEYNSTHTCNAVAVENGTLNISNCTVTGDAYANKSGATLSLNNVTLTRNIEFGNLPTGVTVSLTGTTTVQGEVPVTAGATINAESTTSINKLVVSNPSEGLVVVTKTGSTNLSPSQVGTLDCDGYKLYTDASGNLAIKAKVASTYTKVDGSEISATVNGTTATGFYAEITPADYTISSVNVSVNGTPRTAQSTNITGGSVYIMVIVNNAAATDTIDLILE